MELKQYQMVVQSWDTAIKAGANHDASVCLSVGQRDGMHYLLDALVVRAEYPQLKRRVLEMAERFTPHAILVEDKASGQSLIQDLRREGSLPIIPCMPRGDKVTRFAQVTPLIEAGKVALPRMAQWLPAFEAELVQFPHGAHDDQVDALSQYLNWVRDAAQNDVRVRVL